MCTARGREGECVQAEQVEDWLPVNERGKGVDQERGSHDNEEVTLLHVLLDALCESVWQCLTKEYYICSGVCVCTCTVSTSWLAMNVW